MPSSELQDLDSEIPRHPKKALAAALDRLANMPAPTPFIQAQLYAIVAEARDELDQPELAQSAIDNVAERLSKLPPNEDTRRLHVRIELLQTEIAITTNNDAQSGAGIDHLLAELPAQSLERACALAERAIAYDFAGQPDQAVIAALAAYHAATEHGWRDAKVWSAYTLAVDFREAGLFDQAQKMISEVIAIESADDRQSSLVTSEYEQGKIYIATQHFAEAQTALKQMRVYAQQAGDRTSAAVANIPLCQVAILNRNWKDADESCRADRDDLLAGHRADFLALLTAYRARLNLERHRPARALAELNSLISPSLHSLLPTYEPQIFRDQGRALAALHRYREAYASMSHATDLDTVRDLDERNRRVAVLSAVVASDELNSRNALLETTMRHQQLELVNRETARRLWLLLATVAASLSVALAALLGLARRHWQRSQQHESILRSVSSRAPDAILLLDQNARVRFANRNLFGAGPTPVIGLSVLESMNSDISQVVMAAIQKARATHDAVDCRAETCIGHAALRQYSISVLPAVDNAKLVGFTLRALDVTEARALEREVIDSASRERHRLSSEIHEGLGQQLAGIMLMLGNLSLVAKRSFNPALKALADEAAGYVAESIQSARELAKDLAPVAIGHGSLSIAMDNLVKEASARLRITVTNNCFLHDHQLTDLASDHVYRICREAITNAALHGHCTRADVNLQVRQDDMVLSISNDGSRLTNDEATLHGFGVKMMAYRARLLGGDLQFSEEEGITVLTVRIPMSRIAVDAIRTG